MRNSALSLALIVAFLGLFHAPAVAAAQPAPASIVIVAEGMKGAEIAIPRGKTVDIRLEGHDSRGAKTSIDASKVVWRLPGKYFSRERADGFVKITALKDSFDLGGKDVTAEPTGMLMASYDGLTAGVMVHGVLNLEEKWVLKVTGDTKVLDIKQSGRWVKAVVNAVNYRGTVTGKELNLRIDNYPVLGIPQDLYPKVTFASRTSGTGIVVTWIKNETMTVEKQP